MNLKDIMAVSGLPGLYRLVSSRNNGIVVSDMDQDKTRFCSIRKHQFTPLETVAIYTYDDSTELAEIFKTMATHGEVIDMKESNAKVQAYFREILPEYDEDRVYVSDMKKVIKWYNFLNDRNLLNDAPSDEEE